MRFLIANIGASLLLASSFAVADDCVLSDDFNDNSLAPLWVDMSTHPGLIGVQETGGRLGFWANANGSETAVALSFSDGWKIDMSQDWALEMSWHIDDPFPGVGGDCGIAIGVVLEGDLANSVLSDAFTICGGRINDPDLGEYDYEIARKWDEGDNSEYYNYFIRDYTDVTLYVWYVASLDVVAYNDKDDVSTALVIPSLHSVSPSQEGWLVFGTYSFDAVPSFNSSNYWADNLCLRYGNFVGPAVGACCVEDVCIETLEFSCDGNFLGEGTTCGDCVTPCPGDITGDGQVNTADLLTVIAQWQNPYNVDDLLLVISNWNNCP